ncbi:MAG: phytoene/squalene synthase family protein [Saprospiraceae bacterium]|nr:phytoene/squalene synthase family protein [Saprospiraceae bacterium]
MKSLYDNTSFKISKLVTHSYSTSFSLGIRLLAPDVRPAIYSIYGFVRYADEIVDTFHSYNRTTLLDDFIGQYKKSLEEKISMNPILNSFQEIVHKYGLYDLVEDFLDSMKMDLEKKDYESDQEYKKYIYGSADVVGLMCLLVFVYGDREKYEELKPAAMSLGSAFQKVNFLRDIKNDFENLGRSYFPNVDKFNFNEHTKKDIITDIEKDFADAYKGIQKLPINAKLGVFIAYKYYLSLLRKLKRKDSKQILASRIRISNPHKVWIFFKSLIRHKFNLI